MMAFSDGAVVAMGFGIGAASMLSIGPNNLMIIREGLVRGRVVAVATAVWMSYVLLLVLAMTVGGLCRGIGATMQMWLSLGGVLALSWFAFCSIRACLVAKCAGAETGPKCKQTRLIRVLAVVWLNPLTYLELFLAPAAYCATLDGAYQRPKFIACLVITNTLACYGYAMAGRLCAALIKRSAVVRVFDMLSAALLTASALALASALAMSGLLQMAFAL
jgi:L-lysine exporter family protein LysE/ArgO